MTMRAASFRLKQLTGPSGNATARSLATKIGPHGEKMCSSTASAGKVAAAAAAVAAMFSVMRPKSTDDVVVANGERRESGSVVWGRRRSNQLKCTTAKERQENNVTEDGRLFDPEYEYLMVVGGSSNKPLANEIAEELGLKCGNVTLGRYADGEVMVRVDEHVRGKDVYIVQSGQKPVNDNLVELLLMVSTMQRASAKRVTAVIPYFPYKHHRRSVPVSQDLHSRFLWSAAADVGRLLEVMGVDRVIAVDLERPGTGSGGAFLGPGVPVETLLTTNLFAEHIAEKVFGTDKSHPRGVTVISPSSGLVKKAIQFKRQLREFVEDVQVQTFLHARPNSGPVDVNSNELMGNIEEVEGRDVVIVDELIDTGGTLEALPRKLRKAGAHNIYVCSSHGLFNENALAILEESPVRTVFVTNSVPLPEGCDSSKIEQVHIGRYLARMIFAEHVRSAFLFEDDDIVIESPPAYSQNIVKRNLRKAIQFKRQLREFVEDVQVQTFLHARPNSGPVDVNSNELMGNIEEVEGRDVVIVDELIDTGGTLEALPRKLRKAGAHNIYVCSSHGLFNENALAILEESPVRTVFMTNSVPLPEGCDSSKIEQVHIGRYLARMIFAEHVRSAFLFEDDDIVIE